MATWFRFVSRLSVMAWLFWCAVVLAASPGGAAEEARWGKVVDIQGLASLKAATAERWTPICGRMQLQPGDWLRTDLRGANALSIRLSDGGTLTLGPGAMIEIVEPTAIKLFSGDVEIVLPEGKTLAVSGPQKAQLAATGTQVLRARAEKLTKLAEAPAWLKGFRAAATEESLGSLITTIDGRSVPLTVGYHKVSVDIRDQIARTVIEESFVNHSASRLEGVFHFPLPADASISGFGMWIADKLVEADVVEKQRAREIYETILRERRDPGLLEWSGGNIFKARVFPIEPHSEKRIKITYTQVLPLVGGTYRYSYALQSELLKQNPLRELTIDVQVHSALPIASISSPTHEVRQQKTAQSARVEFSAQEYTPNRDFEVLIDVGAAPAVTMIPHRRGDDGYFLLMLQPPGEQGAWKRELVHDGQPLDLVILADTSGSMDRSSRKAQETLIATLLASLGERDQFQLGMCDVDCQWATAAPQSATAQHAASALEQLAKRPSLGWTNLDKTFAALAQRVKSGTQVIYVGDGITTTGDADPVAFAARLKRLLAGTQATFHAVATSSSYESAVLAAMASLGGGSVRRIGADANAASEGSPQSVARALLVEITEPGLRDLKIEFKGLRVARVYPEQLPNLAAGRQQIVLGRYLPEKGASSGEVVVTGTQAGKTVTFQAPVQLDQAEKGNSFIPRLWARMHLDTLLEQGAATAIRDEIIALSEEYQIMTPYTSFLVLETDADRERFKVERRFQIRDGEKFFAEGRNKSQLDLLAEHIKQAANWRVGMRRQIARELASLGRDVQLVQMALPQSRLPQVLSLSSNFSTFGGFGGGGGMPGRYANGPMSSSAPYEDFFALGISNGRMSDSRSERGAMQHWAMDSEGIDELSVGQDRKSFDSAPMDESRFDGPSRDFDVDFEAGLNVQLNDGSMMMGRLGVKLQQPFGWYGASDKLEAAKKKAYLGAGFGMPMGGSRGRGVDGYFRRSMLGKALYEPSGTTLDSLFPALATPPGKVVAPPAEVAWPAEARALAESLLRDAQFQQLAKTKQGLSIRTSSDSYDVRRAVLSRQSQQAALVMHNTWSVRNSGDQSQTLVEWCNDKLRGVFSLMNDLGRERPSTAADLAHPPLNLTDLSLTSLERTYQTYQPTITQPEAKRALLTLTHPSNLEHAIRILIDTERHVVLSSTTLYKGEATSTTKFDKFVEAAGGFWATHAEVVDAKERRISLAKLEVQVLDAKTVAEQLAAQLAPRGDVLALVEPLPSLRVAKQKIASGKADFSSQMVVLAHFAASQQWSKAEAPLAAIQQIAAGKRGLQWISDVVLLESRKHEDLLKELFAAADALANDNARPDTAKLSLGDQYALASELARLAGGVLQNRELMTLADKLRPIYERQPKHLLAMNAWIAQRAAQLDAAGQMDEAFALRKQLAIDNPFDQSLQAQYAQALASRGEYQAAYEWVARVLAADFAWATYEQDALRGQVTSWLEQQGEFDQLADYLLQWTALSPQSSTPYQQLLSVLVRTDRTAESDKLLTAWLQLAQGKEPLSSADSARLSAAVQHALGHGYSMYTDYIEPRWLEPLAQVVRRLSRRTDQLGLANQIYTQSRFRGSDAARTLHAYFLTQLQDNLDTLEPQQLTYLIDWVISGEEQPDTKMWHELAERLEKRWAAAKLTAVTGNDTKAALAAPLLRILSSRGTPAERLAFLRRQLKEGGDDQRANHATALLDSLLAEPWSQAYEDEAFALLPETARKAAEQSEDPAADAQARLAQQVVTLQKIVDASIASRAKAEIDSIEHPENLSRTELAAKREAAEKTARTALAERLQNQRDKYGEALIPWIDAERLYWEVKLDRNPESIVATAWEFLGPKPPTPAQLESESLLANVLRNRYLTTLEWIAARKNAPAGLAERLLSYFETAIAADAENMSWKQYTYGLLILLDRPLDLEKTLRGWIRPEVVDSTWRIALGYVLAEQAKLPEAIKQFEAVQTSDELPAREYRALAGWYLAQNDQQRHQDALIASYMAEGEGWLYQYLSAKAQTQTHSSRQGVQSIDNQTLQLFSALMQKSSTPQNYYWLLRHFYDATHDFRLLESTAQAVVGNTALRIYPLLENMRQLLGEVRDEATVDSIVDELEKLRGKIKTDTDRRALDLLEMLVERRAAELKNQPGPHAAKSLAALVRSFKRPWADGEPRLMADLLGNLGAITDPALAAEQLAELQKLAELAPPQSIDRLHIVGVWATALAGVKRLDDAVARLQVGLDEFRQANAGRLPQSANQELAILIDLLGRQRHFVRAEELLVGEIKQPTNQQQRSWLVQQLFRVYYSALDNGGATAAGSGVDLYRDAQSKIIAELGTGTPDQHYQLINQLCEIYRKAHEKKLPGVDDDAVAFGDKILPKVLRQQSSYYENLLGTVGDTIHTVSSPRAALAFLIARMEDEPAWIRYTNRNRWNAMSHRLGQWRAEVKNLGDLEPRLLKLVVAELRHALLTSDHHDRSIYYRHHNYFWQEKEAAFAAAAEAVLKENSTSPGIVLNVAEYLYHGLERYNRSIEVLQTAYDAKVLDVSGQARLVLYLHYQHRYRESIALLTSLVERFPDSMLYRTQLMHAYFKTDQPQKLAALLKETDAYFHDKGRWSEGPLAALAQSTLENALWEQAVAYYKELIPLHERTQPNRGIGNGTLSSYYSQQSQAYIQLKQTAAAVEAASAAIVSWGPTHNNRKDAVRNLYNILAAAPDLDAFVKTLDDQVKASGLENPTVRHQIGKVYADRKDFTKAATQLRLAVEVQPGDNELQELLYGTLVSLRDWPAASAQLLAWADVSRRDLNLYKRLGELYQQLEQPAEMERAYTTIVEMQALESESHALLAEVRQQQNRWPEAAAQWREVARLRELEPTGLLKLAAAQIHLQEWDAADETLRSLAKKDWPTRFNTVQGEVQRMQEQVRVKK